MENKQVLFIAVYHSYGYVCLFIESGSARGRNETDIVLTMLYDFKSEQILFRIYNPTLMKATFRVRNSYLVQCLIHIFLYRVLMFIQKA